MKTITYDNPKVGCYVDESSGSADDCNLRTIQFAQSYGFKTDGNIDVSDLDEGDEILSEIADDAVSFLNEQETRPHMFWTHDDNSLFLLVDVESAREDVEFVSECDQEYPDEAFRGEWLHVSDHGNATLYVRGEDGKDTEVWSVV